MRSIAIVLLAAMFWLPVVVGRGLLHEPKARQVVASSNDPAHGGFYPTREWQRENLPESEPVQPSPRPRDFGSGLLIMGAGLVAILAFAAFAAWRGVHWRAS